MASLAYCVEFIEYKNNKSPLYSYIPFKHNDSIEHLEDCMAHMMDGDLCYIKFEGEELEISKKGYLYGTEAIYFMLWLIIEQKNKK